MMAFLVLELRKTRMLIIPHATLNNAQLIVGRLSILVVTSGLLATLTQLAALVTFVVEDQRGAVLDQWAQIPLIIMSSIYTLSFITILSNPRAANTPYSSENIGRSGPHTPGSASNRIRSHRTSTYNAIWDLNNPPSTIVIVPSEQLSASKTDSGTREQRQEKSHSVSFDAREVPEGGSDDEDGEQGNESVKGLPSISELRQQSMGALDSAPLTVRASAKNTRSSSSVKGSGLWNQSPPNRPPPTVLADGSGGIVLEERTQQRSTPFPSQDHLQSLESGIITKNSYQENLRRG
ncbi:hypothetical protein BT69DRAFT_1082868 [Atractiella rhizophila]|nr:hypothetical protein BT69DRAFT_1082868 [Atractiella rhizophila]